MPKRPSILLGGGHLAALWSLALVQPLLGLLGGNPEFFVARENSAGEIIAFALLVTLLPPLLATAVEALVNLVSRPARWMLHLFLVALLFTAIVLQFLKQLGDGPAALMILIALAGGAGLAWAYAHREFMRSLTDILIAAPVVILIAFLFFSDSAELTTGAEDVRPYEVSIENPAPVVMLVFDEFPAGSLMTPDGDVNRRRYPAFAGLADTGDWYRNTTTRGAFTTIAVPSLLTGLDPDPGSLPTAADHPRNLFTLLADGYRINAVEPITQICPDSICPANADGRRGFFGAMGDFFDDLKIVSAHLLLPESMGNSLPDISQTFEGFGDGEGEGGGGSRERANAEQWVNNRHRNVDRKFDGNSTIEEMLAGLGGEGPSFSFAHASDPHYPWTHYPSGTAYANGTEDFRAFDVDEIWTGNEYVTARAAQAHLLDIGYVDRLVARVIDALKSEGRWRETMFIVTADHGGALVPGVSRREAGPENIGEVATVPLFVKRPGQTEGRTIDRHTCSNEIVPIVSEQLGIELPWEVPACSPNDVAISNGSGPDVTEPLSLALEQRQAYVERLAALFGAETGWRRVLELGPNRDLIGRETSKFSLIDGGEPRIEPDREGAALDVYRPGSPSNKMLRQRGTIKGGGPSDLAISVNGRIAAVGESFEEGDQLRYSILLPEWALRAGRNRITIASVERDGRQVTLSSLGSPSSQ